MYTIEKANLIAEQLKKFTTAYTHHVAGQFANINFWINEVVEALKTIDEHKKRFDNIYTAQKKWTEDHGTIVYKHCRICNGRCEFADGTPSLPRLKYKNEKVESRKELVDSAYYFLVRCYKIGLLSQEEFKSRCNLIGTSIDLDDLEKN